MRREFIWVSGVLVVFVVVLLFVYARRPVTSVGVQSAVSMVAQTRDSRPVSAIRPPDAGESTVQVSDAEIDRVFDEAVAFLERLGSSGGGSNMRGERAREGTLQEDAFESESFGDGHLADDEGMAPQEIPPPEMFIEEFIGALHRLDFDALLSMARGQAREKLSQLANNPPPPEAASMLQQIHPTNGRLVNENEFRFNLAIPMESNSPELVLRREGAQWWLDEIND